MIEPNYLTKEKILAMVPGRELDALVARFVFEEEVFNTHEEWVRSGMPHIQYWSNNLQYPAYWNEIYEQGLCVDTFSVDLPAAWDVVEEMNGKFSFTIQRLGDYFYQDENYGWEAIFSSHSDRKVTAKTAPEAICKAALLSIITA